MDIKITPHPLAHEYLFKYYAVIRRIFSNVLGQIEIDYVSIGLIDKLGQLILFSSKPSIEQNLFEKNLLRADCSFWPDFVYQDKARTWAKLYNSEQSKLVQQYKQTEPGLKMGIAIPADFYEYRVIFSFGFKFLNILMQSEKLLAIGSYCLREINFVVPLPRQQRIHKVKPPLQLIINNQVCYENTTG